MNDNKANDSNEYIVNTLSRTYHKKYENYVITRIWHKLDRLDVKFVTQQYVRRHKGYALVDLFLPQIHMFIEIDEPHHKNKIDDDKARDKDIIDITNYRVFRINCNNTMEMINRRIDDIVLKIRKRIKDPSHSFVPWNPADDNNPQVYIDKGKISLTDHAAFRTCKDAANCFGYTYKDLQRGSIKHPKESNILIWFPKLYPYGEWENEISADGKWIRESNKDEKKSYKHAEGCLNNHRNRRIVFAQGKDALGILRYRFKGFFELNREKTEGTIFAVWEKKGDVVKTVKPGN